MTIVVMHLPKLTPNEYALMQHIWPEGAASVGEVYTRMGERSSVNVSRTTVQVQMQRLVKKGWLRRRMQGGRLLYEATSGQEEADWQLTADLTDRIFEGSVAKLLNCFVSARGLDPSEVARLRRIIDGEGEK